MLKKDYTDIELNNLKKQIKECDKDKPYIFVSYARKDAGIVYSDLIELQKRGANIWNDKELEALAGENWEKMVKRAMKNINCKMILFYISEHSIVSAQVCKELLYSLDKDITSYNMNKPLPIIPVDIEKMEGSDLGKWIHGPICRKYGNISPDNDIKIDGRDIDYDFDIARIIWEKIFCESNAQTRHHGYDEHDADYYDLLVKIFMSKKMEGDEISVVNQKGLVDIAVSKKAPDTNIQQDMKVKHIEPENVPAPRLSSETKSKAVNEQEQKAIICTLYGKNYNFSSQSDFMIGVFTRVIEKNADKIRLLAEKLTAVSLIDYERPENQRDMKSQFRTCKTIKIGSMSVCIGTSYGMDAKKTQVKKLLELCGENSGVLDFSIMNEQEAPSDSSSIDGVSCKIYGKPYTLKNQAAYMVKVFEMVMKKHPDKLQQTSDKLLSVALKDYSQMENSGEKPTYYRACSTFYIGTQVVCIGTSFSLNDKLTQIRKLLDICGESHSEFQYGVTEEIVRVETISNDQALKIGQEAKMFITDLLRNERIEPSTLKAMLSQEYATKHLRLGYPLLSLTREGEISKRYWKEPAIVHGTTYYICSQWYESPNRAYFEQWQAEVLEQLSKNGKL